MTTHSAAVGDGPAGEERYRLLAEHSSDLVLVYAANGAITYLSPQARRFSGLEVGVVVAPEDSLVHPDDQDGVTERFQEILRRGSGASSRPFEVRIRRRDGAYRWLEMIATNLLDEPAVGGVVINARDVTERREAADALSAINEALVQTNATLAAVIDNSPLAIYGLGTNGRITMWNPACERVFGWAAADIVGQPASVLDPDPDGPDRAIEHVRRGAVMDNVLAQRVTRDGRVIDVIVSAAPLRDVGERVGLLVLTTDVTDRVAAEVAVRHSEARFRALVQNLSDVVTVVDEEGRLLYTSPAAERLFGFVDHDDSWDSPLERIHPDDQDSVVEVMGRQMDGQTTELARFRLRVADGSWRRVEAFAQDLTCDPAVGGIVVTTRDVTERAQAEALVADQAHILRLVAEGAPLQDTLQALGTVVETQIPGVHCTVLPVGEPAAEGCWSTPIIAASGDRVLGTVAVSGRASRAPDAHEESVVAMVSHLASIAIERREFEDQLAHQAHHDPLTDLPNRTLFAEFLTLALARARRDHTAVAVLFLDLDRFKVVNDSLGHDAGDALLGQLAARLRSVVRPGDTVARFGGDEFTVLCEGLVPHEADAQATEVATRLLAAIELPFDLGEEQARLNTSIGIAIAAPGDRAEDLLRDADAAMYRAKERGKGRWEVFDEEMRRSAITRLELESSLYRALAQQQFRVYYQPLVDLRTGRCVGAEALVRWQHPERGLVEPDVFIELAEETGLIIPIGGWLLGEVCEQVAQWRDGGLLGDEFSVRVNFSARQMAQRDLVARLADALHRTRVRPEMLAVEITERVLMSDPSTGAVHALKELGLQISIDDFGTGYSSLGYLKRFPVDSVKVDESFVDGLGTDPGDSAIVAAVLSLGHALGHQVIAEGVEREHQVAELVALGCDQAQGRWFAPPGPPGRMADLLVAGRSWALPAPGRVASPR